MAARSGRMAAPNSISRRFSRSNSYRDACTKLRNSSAPQDHVGDKCVGADAGGAVPGVFVGPGAAVGLQRFAEQAGLLRHGNGVQRWAAVLLRGRRACGLLLDA